MAIRKQDKQFSLRIRGEVFGELKRVSYERDIHFSTLVRWMIEESLRKEFKVRV